MIDGARKAAPLPKSGYFKFFPIRLGNNPVLGEVVDYGSDLLGEVDHLFVFVELTRAAGKLSRIEPKWLRKDGQIPITSVCLELNGMTGG